MRYARPPCELSQRDALCLACIVHLGSDAQGKHLLKRLWLVAACWWLLLFGHIGSVKVMPASVEAGIVVRKSSPNPMPPNHRQRIRDGLG